VIIVIIPDNDVPGEMKTAKKGWKNEVTVYRFA